MILLLAIALLLLGLGQSLLELWKDESDKPKWSGRKVLSWVYIGTCVVAVIITLLEEQEAKRVSRLIEGISSSVTRLDAVDKRLTEMIWALDSLVDQYEQVKAKLSKQIELDEKTLEEKSPVVGLIDHDIKWMGSDSTSYSIQACIRNFGKRNALITSGHGYAVFFDNDNRPFFNVDIPGNTNKGILEPNETEAMRLCYYSHGVRGFQELQERTSFSVIYLEIHYQDVLMKKNKVASLYSGWIAKANEFGGLKDWQTKLAKKWAIDNRK